MSVDDVLRQLQRLQWEIYEVIKPGVVTAEALQEATKSLSRAVEAVEALTRDLKHLSSQTQRLPFRLGYRTTRHPIWGVDSAGVLRRILTTADGKLVVATSP